jgi:hypothetical protein
MLEDFLTLLPAMASVKAKAIIAPLIKSEEYRLG